MVIIHILELVGDLRARLGSGEQAGICLAPRKFVNCVFVAALIHAVCRGISLGGKYVVYGRVRALGACVAAERKVVTVARIHNIGALAAVCGAVVRGEILHIRFHRYGDGFACGHIGLFICKEHDGCLLYAALGVGSLAVYLNYALAVDVALVGDGYGDCRRSVVA